MALGEALLGALFGTLRTGDVDLLRPLAHLREHRHPIEEHFDESERDREEVLLLPLSIPQLADLQHRQQRRVTGQDAKLALAAGDDDLVDLLAQGARDRA